MWALHPLPSRSTFHFSLFTFHFPKGHFSLFTFHSSLPEGTLLTSHRDHSSLFTLHFSLPEGTLFTQMTQCGASGIAARSIGHCSALHRPLQCAAFFGALSCTAGGTPPGSLFKKTENKNAVRWDTPHSIVCLTLLSCLPGLLRPMRGRRISVPIYSRPRRLSRGYPFRFPENCRGRLHPCFCPTLWSKAFSRDETWADGMSPARP